MYVLTAGFEGEFPRQFPEELQIFSAFLGFFNRYLIFDNNIPPNHLGGQKYSVGTNLLTLALVLYKTWDVLS